MKNRVWMLIAISACCGRSTGEEVGEKPNTPRLPGVPWVVHDGTRPQPRKVNGAGPLCLPPPSDAKVLFGGKSLAAWTVDGKDATWKVKKGVMTTSKGNLVTRESFGPVQLHIEWRAPAGREAHGQAGCNSGVLLMGLYEIQVLESHKNVTYPDGQAAALSGQTPPLVNASLPQGKWQSYDIVFTPPVYEGDQVMEPARATVIHNGVVVHNAKDFLGPTMHNQLAKYPPQHPATGPIILQWHNDPVEFRNIWVRPLGKYDETPAGTPPLVIPAK